jgi:hypothetical protein
MPLRVRTNISSLSCSRRRLSAWLNADWVMLALRAARVTFFLSPDGNQAQQIQIHHDYASCSLFHANNTFYA